MEILLLSPYPERLAPAVERAGDSWSATTEPLADHDADWLVSFGYRHIIREPHLSRFAGRMLNIHISMLPWNRGADPNFWSWFDDTPKGVTIHRIDEGVDTGPVVAQQELRMEAQDHTLRTSYALLGRVAAGLFAANWPDWRTGWHETVATRGAGTVHRVRDALPCWNIMPLGHDTPCEFVAGLGREHQATFQILTSA